MTSSHMWPTFVAVFELMLLLFWIIATYNLILFKKKKIFFFTKSINTPPDRLGHYFIHSLPVFLTFKHIIFLFWGKINKNRSYCLVILVVSHVSDQTRMSFWFCFFPWNYCCCPNFWIRVHLKKKNLSRKIKSAEQTSRPGPNVIVCPLCTSYWLTISATKCVECIKSSM